MRLAKILIKIVQVLVVALLAVLFFGFAIGTTLTAPSNALFFVDFASNKYLSFPCLVGKPGLRVTLSDPLNSRTNQKSENMSQRQIVHLRDSHADFSIETGSPEESHRRFLTASYSTIWAMQQHMPSLKGDEDCRDSGGFVQAGRSLSGSFLERLGLLHKLQSRWNDDGTWNW